MELILIDGEFRSLLRNIFERYIGLYIVKKNNKYLDTIGKLSTRVVSSLIAIYFYEFLILYPLFKIYTSYVFIVLFLILNVFWSLSFFSTKNNDSELIDVHNEFAKNKKMTDWYLNNFGVLKPLLKQNEENKDNKGKKD